MTWQAFLAVRRRALLVGATVGAVQVAVNQGDVWLTHALRHEAVAASVVVKTVLSPLIAVSVAWVSAAGTWADREKDKQKELRT